MVLQYMITVCISPEETLSIYTLKALNLDTLNPKNSSGFHGFIYKVLSF